MKIENQERIRRKNEYRKNRSKFRRKRRRKEKD